ncbi:replicative DNA helicase [Verrucomicrobiota bacterium]|nr:replicative DNA helicase [Verrucomicrobiota bacterium]
MSFTDFHRESPQAPDAEKGVLSSCLLHPACLDMLAEQGMEQDAFYIPAHGELYIAMQRLRSTGKALDFITIAQHLRDHNKLDQIGGPAALNELFVFLPTAANLNYYRDIVLSKWIARRLIQTCQEFAGRGYEELNDIPALLEAFEQAALKVRHNQSEAIPAMKEVVMQTVGNINRLYERNGAIDGLTTGIRALDLLLDGLKNTNFYVIAARPSCGKTALTMNIAEHIAVDCGLPVGVFSAEMCRQQLVQRGLLGRARVNSANLRNGFLSDRDFPAISAAASKMAPAPLWIDDSSEPPIAQIRARARRWRKEKGIVAVFVDYLQLVRSPSKQGTFSREREVAEVSEGMKAMAKELEIPVIVAAQLNRESEKREGGRPRISDLRESGGIEQAADVVGLLWREEMHTQDEEAKAKVSGEALLDIVKHRNGPVGDVLLTFLKEFTTFTDRATAPTPQ